MSLMPIDTDIDVRSLRTSDGIDMSSLTSDDMSRFVAFSRRDQLTNGDNVNEATWRQACIAGVDALENLTSGVATGLRKYVLFQTGLNAALYYERFSSVDAFTFGTWALATIEAKGWGPDGNSSPLGTLHSALMGLKFGFYKNPATGRWEAASGDGARAITHTNRFAVHSLPAVDDQLVAELAELGRVDYDGLHDDPLAEKHPLEGHLKRAPRDLVDSYVDTLAEQVIPEDGWALYAASDVVMWALSNPEELASYRRLQTASLESRRARGFWDFNLSTHEIVFWRTQCGGGDGEWLATRTPPLEDQCTLTPLEVGETRQLSRMNAWDDSNLILVERTHEDTYVAIVDQAQSRGNPEAGRSRNQTASASSLYALYRQIGPQLPSPQFTIDPEFEPFLRHPRPSLPGEVPALPGTEAITTWPPPAAKEANWQADPAGRHQYRFWDGTAWTEHVANNGVATLDAASTT